MKNLNRLTIVLIALFVLSSCGSISILQKRYSRGLNIDLFVHKDDKKPVKKETIKLLPSATRTVNQATPPRAEVLSAFSVDEASVDGIMPEASAVFSAPSVLKTNLTQPSVTSSSVARIHDAPKTGAVSKIKSFYKPLKKKLVKAVSKIQSTHSDVDTLLLVIICFFIPPLAIFLYFGEFETNFLISLILVLLAGGIFLGGGSPFWWSIAVVHALLVVLGIMG